MRTSQGSTITSDEATGRAPVFSFDSQRQSRSKAISAAIVSSRQKRRDRPLDEDAAPLRDPEDPRQMAGEPVRCGAPPDRSAPARLAPPRSRQAAWRRSWRRALEGGGEDRAIIRPAARPALAPKRLVPVQAIADTAMRNAKHGDQAIDPDRRFGALAAQRHGRRLQPVDADRLLVARDVLEADVDIVAGLDHLLGRLDEARLVAVDRRQAGQPAKRSSPG